ncbi:hypothetical protein C2G38_2223040 [Gigaspora rosea]|uniref:Uncharacterized protein n=1 Tax=Gigaspora rosea TaxID=44941 RepID=A0A397UA69_9GLOM|nr:hypothetical protein C2G38_2223040 [Gigaspora rosea]
MPTKNLGPCLIIGCTNTNVQFRTITALAYEKCQRKRTLEVYPYLETMFASSIDMLTKALYYQQWREGTNLELDPVNFERMIETINPGLKVGLCYLIAGLRNKFVNQHKLEVGLYLRASGATWEAIDTMSSLRYSACAKTVDNNFHVYNIDNYHSIHEKRRPDTVSTSTANHFATCVAKPIIECPSVPLVFNGVSIHNPANVEAPRICWYLLNRYTGIFDISYSDYQQLQGRIVSNDFDPIELLTIHSYADNIEERKKKQSIKGVQLLGFKEQNLHSVQDYVSVLKFILSINNKTQHLDSWLIIKDKIIEKFGQACKDVEYQAVVDLLDNLVPATLDVYAILFRSEKDVDLRHLPTAYSTAHPPRPGLCDSYGRSLVDENGMVFVCGHGYHNNCYNEKCKHCKEFYKKGIFKNVQKFLTRIEKGADTLTEEDLDDDDDDEENVEEESEEVEEVDILSKLIEKMNQIEYW